MIISGNTGPNELIGQFWAAAKSSGRAGDVVEPPSSVFRERGETKLADAVAACTASASEFNKLFLPTLHRPVYRLKSVRHRAADASSER